LVKKSDGRVKTRACANGSPQREYIEKEESASPTVATEAMILTAAIDAKEARYTITADIPNAFVQTNMDITDGNDKMIMKIRGKLVDMLVKFDPEL
jgi:hypothetical protein